MSKKQEKYEPLIDDKFGQRRDTIGRVPYDPYALPADIHAAEAHFQATRIAKPLETGPRTIDEASGLPVENQPAPICCDLDQMNFLSPGYPMYFQFVKFCLLILLVIMLTSGLHNIHSFYTGASCQDTDASFIGQAGSTKPVNRFDICTKNYVNQFSLANRDGDLFEIEKADIYNFFTIIVLILLMQFIRKIQKQTALICDERQITSSDYTARVKNIPKNFTDNQDIEEEIKKFFVTQGLPGTQLNVQKVVVCFDCEEKIVAQGKIKDLTIKKAQLNNKKAKGDAVSESEFTSIDSQIARLQSEINAFNDKFSKGVGVAKYFEGEAFVTFETQQELQKVLKHWSMSAISALGQSWKKNSVYKFNGKLLEVKQAPEPTDINWENVGVPKTKKFSLRFFTNVVSLLLVVMGALVVYWINLQKMEMLTELKNKKLASSGAGFMISVKVQAITAIASFLIVALNYVLRIVIQYLTQHERHSTFTDCNAEFAQKLTIAQFLSSAVAMFLVYQAFGNLAGPGGLTYAVFIYFITNAVTQWGYAMFSPWFLYLQIKKYLIRKQKEPQMTQEQLNAIWRYPNFDFPSKYSGYARTTLTAAFFAPLIPLVVPIAFFGILIEYWIDKYTLLRKRSRGPSLGPDMAFDFVEFLEYSMVCFAIGNFLYNVYVTNFQIETQTLAILGFAIGVVNAFLPMAKINEALFPGRDEITTDDKYSEMKHTFLEDYDRANPSTTQIAMRMFISERNSVKA